MREGAIPLPHLKPLGTLPHEKQAQPLAACLVRRAREDDEDVSAGTVGEVYLCSIQDPFLAAAHRPHPDGGGIRPRFRLCQSERGEELSMAEARYEFHFLF